MKNYNYLPPILTLSPLIIFVKSLSLTHLVKLTHFFLFPCPLVLSRSLALIPLVLLFLNYWWRIEITDN